MSKTMFYNRNIPEDAHRRLQELSPQGIRVFAFTASGHGWVIITDTSQVIAQNIPQACHDQLHGALSDGHHIQWVAFPPKAEESWSIITDKSFFNHNISPACHERMRFLYQKEEPIRCVAFPSGQEDAWVIVSDTAFYAEHIPDECLQIMRNIHRGPRRVHHVAFTPGGGWFIAAADYYFARNIDHECSQRIHEFSTNRRIIHLLAFDADGRGWSILSHGSFQEIPQDSIRRVEESFQSGTIWEAMERNYIAGVSLAVIKDNQVDWSCGYGHIDQRKVHAIHPETVFQVGSISKPLTALGVLRLVQERYLELDTDVSNIIDPSDWKPTLTWEAQNNGARLSVHSNPRFCYKGRDGGCNFAVTVRRLLSHNAGVNVHGFRNYARPPLPTLTEILNGRFPAQNAAISIESTPGTRINYSGGGYMVLQKLIEDVTGSDFCVWMRKYVLEPLGMYHSFFDISIPGKLLECHQIAAGHWENGVMLTNERWDEPDSAAGGLYSSVEDLARVLIMLNQCGMVDGQRFLEESLVREMWQSPLQGYSGNYQYGLGLELYNPPSSREHFSYGHGGVSDGFVSQMLGYPNEKSGVVFIANTQNTSFRNEVMRVVKTVYNWS